MSKLKEHQQLRQWCNESWPELYRYIYKRVQNREEAEDVTQDTYARTLPKFTFPEFPSSAYLKTVALNIIRDRWRQRKVRGIQVQLEEALLVAENDVSKVLDSTWVEEVMKQLSWEQQTVLKLRIVEGYSRAETAQKMNKSEDAVRGLQYRAIQNLRGLLLDNLKGADEG
ncbi:MAG: hypothetical protein APF84_14785 [Gracilibacter sp. BRH_c7a]|nr:MAG: hypothetical protein APF84_14785 [Gracilibacter sp. BRH_c7a]